MVETKSSNRTRMLGIATVVLGVLAITTPFVAGEAMLKVIGVLVTAAGVLRLIWARMGWL